MEKIDLLEQLKHHGLDIDDGTHEDGVIITAKPHYLGNYGYYHLTWKDNDAIALKSVYSESLRVLKGTSDFNEADKHTLLRLLNNAEVGAKNYLDMTLVLDDAQVFVKTAEIVEPTKAKQESRIYALPRPLTNAEYQQPSSGLYEDSVILSTGYFGEFMPPVMSYFTESIFEKLINILNPIFDSCNIKTSSPTIINGYGRVYTNITGLESIFKTIELGRGIFRAAHAPHLYIKAKEKHGSIDKKYFPVEQDEINELVEALKASTNSIHVDNIVGEAYYDYPVQLMIIHEYLTVMLCSEFSKLISYFESIPLALEAIYKTRKNSMFTADETYRIPEFFDPACDVHEVSFEKAERETKNISDYISKLSFGKRFGKASKIETVINNIHNFLDLRDSAFALTWKFIDKSKVALDKVGEIAIQRRKFVRSSDIYHFDHDEVKRLSYDTYYSETEQTIVSRRAKKYRYTAQVVVPEIYGRDFENTVELSEKMVIKALDATEHKSLVLNKGEGMFVATNDLTLADYSDKFIAAEKLSVANLDKYKSAKGWILENVSLFSPIAEYAITNNIPLYSGVRFAGIVLDKKVVEIKDDTLLIRN